MVFIIFYPNYGIYFMTVLPVSSTQSHYAHTHTNYKNKFTSWQVRQNLALAWNDIEKFELAFMSLERHNLCMHVPLAISACVFHVWSLFSSFTSHSLILTDTNACMHINTCTHTYIKTFRNMLYPDILYFKLWNYLYIINKKLKHKAYNKINVVKNDSPQISFSSTFVCTPLVCRVRGRV